MPKAIFNLLQGDYIPSQRYWGAHRDCRGVYNPNSKKSNGKEHGQMTWKLSRASTGNPQTGNPKNTVALGICLPQWLFQFYYILGGPCLWFPLEPLQTGLAWWPTKRSLFGGVSNKNYLDFEGLLFVYNHVRVGLESASGKGLLYPP